MRAIVTSLIIFIVLVIQSTLMQYIQFYGVKPNIVVVTIISVALLRGTTEGAVVGFLTGIVYDLVFGRIFGVGALLGLLLGLTVGTLNRKIYKENLIVVILAAFLFTFIFESLIAALIAIRKTNESFLEIVRHIALKEAMLNSVVGVFVHYFICWVNNKIIKFEKMASRKY